MLYQLLTSCVCLQHSISLYSQNWIRSFKEGSLYLQEAKIWKSQTRPWTSFNLTPSLLLPLAFRIKFSLQLSPAPPAPPPLPAAWGQYLLVQGEYDLSAISALRLLHRAFPECTWLNTSTAFLSWRKWCDSARNGKNRR